MTPRKSGRVRFLLSLAITLLFGVVLAVNLHLVPLRRLLQSKTETVRVEDFGIKIISPGIVEPKTIVSVKSELGGNIASKQVKEGDLVRQGQLLMQFSLIDVQMELERRRSQLVQAGKDLDKARANYQVSVELFRQHAIPKKDLIESRQALEKAQEAAELARKDYEAQEKKASQSSVTSPIDGVVLVDKVGTNGWMAAGQELFVIGQTDKFNVRAKVDELDIGKIKPGLPADIRLEAFPNVAFPGEVTKVGAEAQAGAFAEIDVFVEMKDLKEMSVRPNLSAKVAFDAGKVNGALTIPLSSIRYRGDQNYVTVISSKGILTERKVELGPSSEGRIVVLDGLGAGETVLVPQDEAS